MRQIRFIHCADLHIDSPFQGLSEIHPALRDLLYHSTFQSFSNIVDLAVAQDVDCVLIAGDVYDSVDKSLQAQLRFRDGLQRISDQGIPTFVACGNHDPLDSWSASLGWPENVTIFEGDHVQRVPLEKNGEVLAQVYGISYCTRDTYDNLALKFERKDNRLPAIALLHTNVEHNTGHESYAPASLEELSAARMDYWALGHVHTHRILRNDSPVIVYPGNTQARNPRETGPKGCCLVTLEPDGECEIEFVPTDIVRYRSESLDISDCENLDEAINAAKNICDDISNRMNGRHAIICLSLTGKTDLHPELRKGGNINDLLVEVREHFEGREPLIWLERLALDTRGTYDLEALRRGNDFVADIISLYDELQDIQSQHWVTIDRILEPLLSDWQGQKLLDKPSRDALLELALKARDVTLDGLLRSE